MLFLLRIFKTGSALQNMSLPEPAELISGAPELETRKSTNNMRHQSP